MVWECCRVSQDVVDTLAGETGVKETESEKRQEVCVVCERVESCRDSTMETDIVRKSP